MRATLEVRAATWAGEPEGDDNWVRAAFLIDPRDYPAAVLGNAWDMTEASSGAPAWYTMDIDSVVHWSSYTDSIGGMFEGTLLTGHFSDNAMYLHIPGSSLLWIDGDLYNEFSVTGRSSADSTDVVLGWVDSHGNRGSSIVGTLTTAYGRTEPFDLSSIWSGRTIESLWLRFDPANHQLLSSRIRVGRAWLGEGRP